jgi:hypothetical protein
MTRVRQLEYSERKLLHTLACYRLEALDRTGMPNSDLRDSIIAKGDEVDAFITQVLRALSQGARLPSLPMNW